MSTLVLTAMLCACASPQTHISTSIAGAQADLPSQWHAASPAAANSLSNEDSATLSRWWSLFDDPVLTRLVEEAIDGNTDLAAATGRLRSARAALNAARSGLFPTLTAGASASRNETLNNSSGGSTFLDAGVDASWELDLFGKLSGAASATRASLEASRASLFDVQRSVVAEIALNYLTLRDSQARLAIAESNLAIQRENLQIAEWRYQAGLTGALDVEQARTLVAQTEAALPPLRQTISTSINQIDVLRGRPPGESTAELRSPAPVPAPSVALPTGLPAELIERRPDVLAARHTLEADVTRIGVARADLYPALRLSGSISTSSLSVPGLFDTIVGNLVGSVTAPIFQGGRIRAQIEQQRGVADTSLANYRSSILTALQDVESALIATTTAQERETALARAESSARETLRLAEIRYRSGTIDFQQLLDAQRTLLSAQDNRQAALTARATAAVQLYKALGGGWPVRDGSTQESAG